MIRNLEGFQKSRFKWLLFFRDGNLMSAEYDIRNSEETNGSCQDIKIGCS